MRTWTLFEDAVDVRFGLVVEAKLYVTLTDITKLYMFSSF